jgi:hypothetical protein
LGELAVEALGGERERAEGEEENDERGSHGGHGSRREPRGSEKFWEEVWRSVFQSLD